MPRPDWLSDLSFSSRRTLAPTLNFLNRSNMGGLGKLTGITPEKLQVGIAFCGCLWYPAAAFVALVFLLTSLEEAAGQLPDGLFLWRGRETGCDK